MRFNLSRWTSLTVLALTPSAFAAVPLRTVALSGQPAEGTSAAFAAVRTPVIDGTGLTAFVAELTGDGVDETNSVGMYSEGAGFLHLWARNGTQADGQPEGVIFRNFNYPVMNREGKIAFTSYLGGPGITDLNDGSIWTNAGGILALVAQEGTQPPGVEADVAFRILQEPVINAAGHVAFTGILGTTGTTQPRGIGNWIYRNAALELVIRSGTPAPGLPAGVNIADIGSLPAMNDNGHMVIITLLSGTGVENNNRVAIYSNVTGALVPIARAGSAAPGTLIGANFQSFLSSPKINNAGQVAFLASLAGLGINTNNDSGLWTGTAGNLSLVARKGAQAPNTQFLTNFAGFESSAVVLNSAGRVAFMAYLTGPGVNLGVNDQGIWSNRNGNVELVARTGATAPGMPNGMVFSFLFGDIVMDPAGNVTFTAEAVVPNNPDIHFAGIWKQDANGLTLVAREREAIEVAPGDSRTVDFIFGGGASGLEDGRGRSANADGDTAFSVEFTDGSTAVFSTALDVGQGADCGTCGVGAPMSLSAIPMLFAAKQLRRKRRHKRSQ